MKQLYWTSTFFFYSVAIASAPSLREKTELTEFRVSVQPFDS